MPRYCHAQTKFQLSRAEKAVLWQKTDALEFEQKLRDEETERDVNYCLDCHSQFSWWIRKYNCRSDGFLYTVIEKPTVHITMSANKTTVNAAIFKLVVS